MHSSLPPGVSFGITAALICLILFLRVRGIKRTRRLRLEQLWIVPAIYAVVTVWVLFQFPPQGAKWLWLAAALAAGALLGWRRGAMMRISVDPGTHALNQQASPAAFVFIVALVLIRQALRSQGQSLGLDVVTMTDLLMVSALGLLAAMRAEMFLRGRRLLDQARRAGV